MVMKNEKIVTYYVNENEVIKGEDFADQIIHGLKKPEEFVQFKQIKLPSFYSLIDTRKVMEKSQFSNISQNIFVAGKYGKLNRIYNFMHHRGSPIPEVVLNVIKDVFLSHDKKFFTTAKALKWRKIRVSGSYIKHLAEKHNW